VAEYAEAMLAGDRFPPVVVFQHDGGFILADGWQRVKAACRAKLGTSWLRSGKGVAKTRSGSPSAVIRNTGCAARTPTSAGRWKSRSPNLET
jgi:hypothetical protein